MHKIIRKKTQEIKIGKLKIGAANPIAIQSMAKVPTWDVCSAVSQIKNLAQAGCEIVRVAVENEKEALALRRIRQKINIPLVADIHFNYKLALLAIDGGVDKIRLNPGNIYKQNEIRDVVTAAKYAKIPIRVGINSGSFKRVKGQRLRGKGESAQMVNSALSYIRRLEKLGFYDIVVSLKASAILDTIEAYEKFSRISSYPLHLGVTATGSSGAGLVKSAIGIGALLLGGIGDTLRVSLTAGPAEEVKAARQILQALEIRGFGPEIISCPTCSRCKVDLINIVRELENQLATSDYRLLTRPVKLAVMGCVVNGPGEAKEADLGIAFGAESGVLFRDKKIIRKIKEEQAVGAILGELRAYGTNKK